MKAFLVVALLGVAVPARADSLDQVVGVLAGEDLPAGLGVAQVHLPPAIAHDEVAPADVTVVWPQAPRAGRASARVTITGKGHAKPQRLWVPITIAALAPVAFATRDLAAGDTITNADVKRELRAVDHAAPTQDIVGATVTAPIAAGAAVLAASIDPPAPVARGAQVAVKVTGGGFTVSAQGSLDRAARVGGPAVVHLANRTLVHGVLVDAGTVLVEKTP